MGVVWAVVINLSTATVAYAHAHGPGVFDVVEVPLASPIPNFHLSCIHDCRHVFEGAFDSPDALLVTSQIQTQSPMMRFARMPTRTVDHPAHLWAARLEEKQTFLVFAALRDGFSSLFVVRQTS